MNTDIRDSFFDQVISIAEADESVIFLTADMDAWSLKNFRSSMPDRFINVGIAEQNMISLASGLSFSGKKVFVFAISPFVSQRCHEQVKLDLCSMNTPVVMIGAGPGLSYGSDGPSHHSIDDISSLKAFPNISIYNVCDQVQAKNIANVVYNDSSGPSYVRLEKGVYDPIYDDCDGYKAGMKLFGHRGNVLVISSGIMVHNSLYAIDLLAKRGIEASLLDMFRVKPLDVQEVIKVISSFDMIVTVEENMLIGGIGSSIAEIIVDHQIGIPLKRIGLPNEYSMYLGGREWFHEIYKLTPYDLTETITSFFELCNKQR